MTRTTENLIEGLVAELKPRRRLQRPGFRATLWLAGGLAFVLAVALWNGVRDDLLMQFAATPRVLVAWLAALGVAATAALAAFHVALPDRDRLWALLPLPAVVLWFATLGYGCLADWWERGAQGVALGASLHCVEQITIASAPLLASVLLLLRHAAGERPVITAGLAALASAALASVGLTLFHDLDSALMVLVWHGLPTALIVLLAASFGGTVLRAARLQPR
jgi:hypothetical protein